MNKINLFTFQGFLLDAIEEEEEEES